jgi:hypothetical protein
MKTQKYSLYPNEHPANCTLRWRLSNCLGVYLSWLQAGFSHHTRQPQLRRAKHHAKRVRRCRSTNSGRLMTLLDLSLADFRRFLTVLVDRRLLGRVEAVIQARWGYTRYWTFNNRCRQVIHKWRFESEMTILSCILYCEGQYLKWTCFTANLILWLNIYPGNPAGLSPFRGPVPLGRRNLVPILPPAHPLETCCTG